MVPIEKRLGEVAEVMAGVIGFGVPATTIMRLFQPNSFSDTGIMNTVEPQKRSDEISNRQRLMVGDILVKRLNPSFVHVVGSSPPGWWPHRICSW